MNNRVDRGISVDSNMIARATPWFGLVVGFLMLDGLFRLAIFLVPIIRRGDAWYNLLLSLPPMSFMRWYAEGGTWGWTYPLSGLFIWFTPMIEMVTAFSILRTPARTKRSVTIAAATILAHGVTLLLRNAVPGEYMSLAQFIHLSESVTFAWILIWIVHRFDRIKRPANLLLATFLLAFGILSSIAGFGRVFQAGLQPIQLFHNRPQFDAIPWCLYQYPVGSCFLSFVMILAGLLLLYARPPVRPLCCLICLASAVSAGCAVWANSYLVDEASALDFLWIMTSYNPQNILLFLALTIWMWRHQSLWRDASPGYCECGYNLTGNTSGVCPECGANVHVE